MRDSSVSVACAGILSCALAACGGEAPKSTSSLPVGSLVQNPDPDVPTYFVVEQNTGGQAASMRIVRVVWGRLVDVYALGETTPRFRDFLIGDDITDDNIDFDLTRHPVTGREHLTILSAFGTPTFLANFTRLETGLQPFLDKGLAATELPPFTALPRNGAMALVFNDVLDDGGGDPNDIASGWPGTVTSSTVRFSIGYPPNSTFEPRIIPDPNHGDLIDGEFHSTRVLIDVTVSQFETGAGSVPLNGLGLPEAISTAQPNVVVRVPTQLSAAAQQFALLTNLDGHGVAFTGNGSTDPVSPSLDVVRAFRSGGRTAVTGDFYNGFLRDNQAPTVVGSQGTTLTDVTPAGDQFYVSFQYATLACAVAPPAGSILDLGSAVLEVVQDGGIPNALGEVTNVLMQVIHGNPAGVQISAVGDLRVAWDVALGAPPECFVSIAPTPGQAPAALVATTASIEVRFNEPVDPESVRAFDTFGLAYFPAPANLLQRSVAGTLTPSPDYTRYSFVPSLPLKHVAATADVYNVTVASGASGVTDLAGNALATPLATTGGSPPRLTLDPTQAAFTSGSLGLTFGSADEDGNGSPELRGQLIFDLIRGRIRPRSVTRFSGVVDTLEPTMALDATVGGLANTRIPLTRYGARLQTVWRYHDMGLTLLDQVNPNPIFSDATFNLDVEGLNWAPQIGALLIDHYPRFQVGLAHSKFLPDEALNGGLPAFPDSGLVTTFADNQLDPVGDPLTAVHPAGLGYTIQPLDLFTATTGTRMAPWPLNQNLALSNYAYWTWRDTAKTAVGGPNGNGADYSVIGLTMQEPNFSVVYATNAVPSICLPMLMDFRAYPSTTSGAVNFLAGVLATPVFSPTQLENQPYFTAYSAGGVQPNGTVVNVEPDSQTTAQGANPPGGPNNLPRNQIIYFGQADFVTRVNRVHTVWFDTGALNDFAGPVFEPPISAQPPGTQLLFAYRGATAVVGNGAQDASNYDPYGNPAPGVGFTPTFLNGDPSWFDDLAMIDNARFLQVRITMVSNPESGVSPELSSLGFATFQ